MSMLSQQKIGLLFLDSTKFDLYTPNGTVISYNLPPTLVRDLEVLDKDALATQITSFIDANKIAPITLIVVLSERILFSRDFVNVADLQEQVTIVQDFLDSIPFDNLSTKTFKSEKGFKVVAANRDFYDHIKSAFEAKGFLIEAVAPITVIAPELATLTVLDRELARKIISKINIIKQNALEIHYEAAYNPRTLQQDNDKKKYKIRLFAMIGTFGVLLIVMAVLAYQTFKPEPVKVPPTTQATAPIPKAVVTITPTPPSEILLKKTLQISIINPARSSTVSAGLRTNLLASGYDNVKISTQSSSSSTRTRILFKSTVPTILREDIVKITSALFENPVIVEQEDSADDISIYIQ